MIINKQFRDLQQTTMSLLRSQLQSLRNKQGVAPFRTPIITLLFDKNTSINTVRSLVRASNLEPVLDPLFSELMDEKYFQINRNQLTKEQNLALSFKLKSLLIEMSSYFLFPEYQHLMEYLLRNFNVHLFQSQTVAIMYLQYWKHPVYFKLVQGIPVQSTLQFVQEIKHFYSQNPKASLNISYIVKVLGSNPYLLQFLINGTKQYKGDFCSNDPKIFLFQLFNEFVNRKMNILYKIIVGYLIKNKCLSEHLKRLGFEIVTKMIEQDALTNKVITVLAQQYYHINNLDIALRLWQKKIVPQYFFSIIANHEIKTNILKQYNGSLSVVVKNISSFQNSQKILSVINKQLQLRSLNYIKNNAETIQEEQFQFDEEQKPIVLLEALLKQRGVTLNFNESETIKMCEQLLDDYYCQQPVISQKQKQWIILKIPIVYSLEYLTKDLMKGNYLTILRYYQACESSEELSLDTLPYAKHCLMQIKVQSLGEILYGQVISKSIEIVAHQANYKAITFTLSTIYRAYLHFASPCFTKNTNLQSIVDTDCFIQYKLNSLMLKISEKVFSIVGFKKGKYYHLIQYHCIMFSKIVEEASYKKQLRMRIKFIKQAYVRLYHIFKQHLSLIHIGLTYLLTKKGIKQNKPFEYISMFIKELILPCLRQNIFNITELSISFEAMIKVCCQMKNDTFTKKTFIRCYNLTNVKYEQIMVKKIIIFLNILCEQTEFKQHFKHYLQDKNANDIQQLESILQIYSLIYSYLLNSTLRVQSLMKTLISLFPLQTRIYLLCPLLPHSHVYRLLHQELAIHNVEATTFPILQQSVEVLPKMISVDYVYFVTECLKRGYVPSDALIADLLHDKQLQKQAENLPELICELAHYANYKLYPHIQTCMELLMPSIMSHTSYSLAIIYRLATELKEIVQPYLPHLLLQAIDHCPTDHLDMFLKDLSLSLAPSTLINLIKETHSHVLNTQKYIYFWEQVANVGVGDSLTKIFLRFSLRCLEDTSDIKAVAESLAQIIANMALKLNENQLRKVIIEVTRWAELKQEVQQNISVRKILLFSIFSDLSQRLQELFVPFFGYVFQGLVKDLAQVGNNTIGKIYAAKCLQALTKLFTYDTDKQFLDGIKFDELSQPLSQLFLTDCKEELAPCLLALCSYTTDDYHLKSLNYKILLLVRKSQLEILTFEESLIDLLKERYLVLINDIVPFLLEATKSKNSKVVNVVRSIIRKIEDLSGDKIENYIR